MNNVMKYMNVLIFCLAWYTESSKDKVFDEVELQKAINGLSFWFGYNFTLQEVSALFSMIAKVKGEPLEIKL
jgi:hypothetical protein